MSGKNNIKNKEIIQLTISNKKIQNIKRTNQSNSINKDNLIVYKGNFSSKFLIFMFCLFLIKRG